jgi:hypothetical protein
VSILASSYYVLFVKYAVIECILERLCLFDHIFYFQSYLTDIYVVWYSRL